MSVIDEEVLIVGAGPAGMAAALAAHRLGATVAVVDENPRPGGQIFRQPLTSEVEAHKGTDRSSARGQALIGALRDQHIRHLPETVCWGASPQRRLFASSKHDGSREIRASAVILATGAYERPMAFPGWTLPGVMTAGGAQAFLKSQGICPGRRFLLAGSGPLQFALAAQLVKAGAHVEAIVDTTRPSRWRTIRQVPGLLNGGTALLDGGALAKVLLRARVPVIWGAAIRRAHGQTRVEGAQVGAVDDIWAPIGTRMRSFDVDTICLGYGFVPSIELATLLGCDLRYEAVVGGWVPFRDQTMATSQKCVYVVGDGSGAGGSVIAEIEGEIAGISAALELGYGRHNRAATARRASLQSSLRRLNRFARALGWIMTPKEGSARWITADTPICRCEEVTAGEVQAAIDQGARGLRGVKLRTRAGMGLCQGRMCAPAITAALDASLGQGHQGSSDAPRPQIPIKPIESHELL